MTLSGRERGRGLGPSPTEEESESEPEALPSEASEMAERGSG